MGLHRNPMLAKMAQLNRIVLKTAKQTNTDDNKEPEHEDSEATINSGNTAWMITATALVLFMTLPGLALFYGGLVQSKMSFLF